MIWALKSVWHTVNTYRSTSYQRVVRRLLSLNFVLPNSEYKDDLHCLLWHKLTYSPCNPALTSESRQVTGLADRGNPRSQRRLVKGMQEGGPHPGWAERSQVVLLFMTFYFKANITPVRLTNLSNDSIKIARQYQEQMSSMRSGNVGATIGERRETWNWVYQYHFRNRMCICSLVHVSVLWMCHGTCVQRRG